MNRYDENYSAYFKAPSKEYPSGSAVDSSSEDNLDGTPYLAAFFNDVIGFMGAVFYGVFGNPKVPGETVERSVTNEPDNATKSDVWDAIKKFVTDKVNDVKKSLDDFIDTKGKANGFAPLDADGQVPESYLEQNAVTSVGGHKGDVSAAQIKTDIGNATTSADGLMSASDKKKLNGIESGAQVNTVTSVSGRTGNVTASQIRSDMAVMLGATASSEGEKGLVPAPAAGFQDAFLKGNGTWGFPASAVVDSIILKDSVNALQNKVVAANMYTAVCETPGVIATKNITIDGFKLEKGATVRVLFWYANMVSDPSLKVNDNTAVPIVVYESGVRHLLKTSTFATGTEYCWYMRTTLELVYDGADFVVMGNPVLLSGSGTDSRYIKYANGLIEQWGCYFRDPGHDIGDDERVTVMFPIAFTTRGVVNATALDSDNTGSKSWFISIENGAPDGANNPVLKTGFRFCNTDNQIRGFYWSARGY